MSETKSKKQAERERQEQLNDLCAVLDQPAGRRFIWRLLETAHLYRTSFVNGQSNTTIFREGERNVGIWLLNELIVANPDAYVLMQHEQLVKEQDDG